MAIVYFKDDSEALAHYGIKGMKWGVRRYQNEDGSLTSAGKNRYMEIGKNDTAVTKGVKKDYNNMSKREFRQKYQTSKRAYAKRVARSSTGDPFKDRRAQMTSSKVGKKMFDKSVNAEASLRTEQHLNKKADKLMANRSKGLKVTQALLVNPRITKGYYKMRAAGYSKAGSAAVAGVLGRRASNNIAARRYQESNEGRRYRGQVRSQYYKD